MPSPARYDGRCSASGAPPPRCNRPGAPSRAPPAGRSRRAARQTSLPPALAAASVPATASMRSRRSPIWLPIRSSAVSSSCARVHASLPVAVPRAAFPAAVALLRCSASRAAASVRSRSMTVSRAAISSIATGATGDGGVTAATAGPPPARTWAAPQRRTCRRERPAAALRSAAAPGSATPPPPAHAVTANRREIDRRRIAALVGRVAGRGKRPRRRQLASRPRAD